MIGLATPRQVIRELGNAKIVPWWIERLKTDITRHLERCTHNGMPIIDTPMSEKACQAVLQEAVDYVQRPRTDAELQAEFDAAMIRFTPGLLDRDRW